jgi:hypothetical protein
MRSLPPYKYLPPIRRERVAVALLFLAGKSSFAFHGANRTTKSAEAFGRASTFGAAFLFAPFFIYVKYFDTLAGKWENKDK